MKDKVFLKDKVLNLYDKGYSNKEIGLELNISPSVACTIINVYAKNQRYKEGYFNVNELDCWIFPSISKYKRYDSR
jgi:orotate phosphoribosyltransferase-like protein